MKKKNAFTLVELIVVITILAVLATIWFIAFSWNTSKARKVKLQSNIKNINKLLSTKLSSWEDIDLFLTGNLLSTNWVNTGATIGSWAYILWDLEYKVWNLNFFKLQINWDNFKIETDSWDKDYIFSYLITPDIIFHQIAGEYKNESWRNEAVIYGKFYNRADTDAKWLISESWSLNIWLENNQVLTWSLY